MYDVIVIGAGLSGAVFADRFARVLGKRVLVVEKRNHIAGNCHDYVNEDGILMNQYGLHLFHCNDKKTFDYIRQFSEWIRYDHKVVAQTEKGLVPIPVCIETVNRLCNTHITDANEMDEWLKHSQIKNKIENGEDACKARVGEQLYYELFHDYTKKQWDKYPCELDKSVLERIPVRNNHDTRYFNDTYQVIPKHGYTAFVSNMLDHPLITVKLGMDYNTISEQSWFLNRTWLIYTGPVDSYFHNSGLAPLEYRSIEFKIERVPIKGFYQKNVVVNYPNKNVDFTRIVEYKHLPYNDSTTESTTIVREYTTSKGEPYYPVPTRMNQELYAQYKKLAEKEEEKNVIFVGRLANYKYKNMNEAILDSLNLFEERVLGVKV